MKHADLSSYSSSSQTPFNLICFHFWPSCIYVNVVLMLQIPIHTLFMCKPLHKIPFALHVISLFILFYFIFVHMLGEYTTQAIYCSSLQLHGLLNSQSSLKLQWSQQDSPASKLTKEWDLINVIYRVRIKLQIHWLKSSLSINHKRQYLTLTWILSLQTLLRMGCMVVWWFSLSPQSLKVVSCSLCVGFSISASSHSVKHAPIH